MCSTENKDVEESDLTESEETVKAFDLTSINQGNLGLGCLDPDVESRIQQLLGRMTLEQKVREMHGLSGEPIDSLYHAGGDEDLGIPPFKMADGPRGVRAGNATAFPVAMARGATWDPALERTVGQAIGLELRARGGNVLLAPCINLLRHPGWGRSQETYSEDPLHLGRMGAAFAAGAQNHVIANAKHFAANSIELSRFEVSANMDERTLREVYLPHFRYVVQQAGVGSVMTAYNRVNEEYCGQNEHLLRDILKGEWGFKGFVISDWVLGTRSTAPSARAGLDIEMPVSVYYGDALIAAVQAGEVDEAMIDEAVGRILRQKLCFGLDEMQTVPDSVVESPEHLKLALEVARRSIVLLKNQKALPLERNDLKEIAVIGSLTDTANLGDRGSSSVVPSEAITPLQGILGLADGLEIRSIASDTLSDADRQAIGNADAVVVIAGLTWQDEGEYIPVIDPAVGDRVDLGLPEGQVELIREATALNGRVIVILEGGSAIRVREWIDEVEALVMAWYPGARGGTAIAEVLFGEVNPSGKLPVTFARSESQLPPFDTESHEVSYGFLHGYRLQQSNKVEPEFPFGHGLSYTSFEYDRLTLDRKTLSKGETLKVCVDVHNRGGRAGREIVQMYLSAVNSAVSRPPKELKGFGALSLESGQTKTLEMVLDADDLAYFDEAGNRWVLEAGAYQIQVGSSSRDLPLVAEISLLE